MALKYHLLLQEQAKIAKLGLEMKLITSEMDAETDKWEEPDNDIVKRAKNMSRYYLTLYLICQFWALPIQQQIKI